MDPVSLVVTAVALGASAGVKDTASLAVKDAYAGLKTMLGRRRVDVSGVERRPDSHTQQAALQETLAELDGTPDAIDEQMLVAAAALTDAVAAHDVGLARVVGIDLRELQAAFVQIGSVESAGDGVVVQGVRTSGGFSVDSVRAGLLSRRSTDPPLR